MSCGQRSWPVAIIKIVFICAYLFATIFVFVAEEHQADQADAAEHGHPTGDDLAVPFSGGAEEDELDAPTGGNAASLPPQGTTTSSEGCNRPPRGRMALLHEHLGTENDLRMALVKEEHALRVKLLQEDHDTMLALKTEKLKLEIELLEQQKQHQAAMFKLQAKVEQARLQKALKDIESQDGTVENNTPSPTRSSSE